MRDLVMSAPRWHVCTTVDGLHERATAWIADAASTAIAERGVFRVVLAGGETPRGVYAKLRDIATDWQAWDIYFGDERCVSGDDSTSNSGMVHESLLNHVSVPRKQVHVIHGELGAAAAAADYCVRLAGVPEFDLVLLGLGQDGHTASLFPGHDWGDSPQAPDVLAVRAAPKPPSERVSLSARRLSLSRAVLFLVAGREKREAVARWRTHVKLPVVAICPAAGTDVLIERICLED